MAGILAGVKIVCCGSLFGCPRYCFLINGDHFCLFQNTIFELNSGVFVRIFGNQRVTKNADQVLIRINMLHHFFLPKFQFFLLKEPFFGILLLLPSLFSVDRLLWKNSGKILENIFHVFHKVLVNFAPSSILYTSSFCFQPLTREVSLIASSEPCD